VAPEPVDGDRVERLREELGLPPEVCRLLVRRGQGDPSDARRFLRPGFDQLHRPELLPGLGAGVERIEAALARGERILVHGDYDADGLTAAALLTLGLRELGGDVEAFVPHRTRDGYDLGAAGLARAAEVEADLVVTADCGISAVEAVAEARRTGRDVVVTDHHEPPDRLPEAAALVNPSRRDGGYPFGELAGVGVAYKLLCGLFEARGRSPEALNPHLDLVALGTVADAVPLVGENRVLVRAGLRAMEQTRRPGLRALLAAAGVEGEIDAGHLGYRLGPRLNAVGRVGEAATGLRLLLTDDAREARALAERLEGRNRERRELDRRVLEEAERQLAETYDPERDRVVVVAGDDWPAGVLGIAASRLVDRLHRPTVLVSFEGDLGRGSGRSIPGFHLQRALEVCAPMLERHGGHRMAAGLEIRRDRLTAFAERLGELAREELSPDDLEPRLELDLSLPLERADGELHGVLRHLAPFGAGNPRPVIASRDVGLRDVRTVGSEDAHLRATLVGPAGRLRAVGFGLGDRAGELQGGGRWDVAYELVEDRWRGRRRVEARLRDLRPAS
jgi:single-stranded-DNA-specific exonuclease